MTEVAESTELAARTDALAEKVASGARQSASAVKKLVLTSFKTGLEEQMELEGRLIAECADSPTETRASTRFSKSADRSSRTKRRATGPNLHARKPAAAAVESGPKIWPTQRHRLVQRYSDAGAAELLVPTVPAFAASKTATRADRLAPRDLWDP
ncbi:enoyl-CoA hydratase domain protein [Mycobacterium kansasii]|uniref:Enoyl-CoA hydratase domain protein n=1 Tax=Mycobacterium kansasii TaxID=1768 RepID=A0A1V3XWM3_MYCKA|nr:enoyl-CoA hydratase domain protein [Mycobacterium kansasii]